ncbi:phage tail protein [Pigmentiphaga sp. CHJ604]|uniref:phage tail protein n=1 Tax=Pigmentiphaga sp. CHJ604 TaxID=3081984 RepID=UPI0030D502D7
MSGGGKGGGEVTVGYRYYAGMHLALCHGPVDSVNKIVVGERTAWTGPVTTGGPIRIDAPDLFGGDAREGGIVGDVDVLMGDAAQGANGYLAAQLGGLVPAFRGIVSLVLRQVQLSAMNPYIKPWSVECTRTRAQSDGSPQWYAQTADIGGDMNPAHIVRECLTDRVWGRGYSPAELDDGAFRAAADRLYQEGFGLSLLWDQQQDIDKFIEGILQHIDASLYVSPRTGLFILKLTRDDYDPASLLQLDPSNVVSLDSFERTLPEELINQVTLTYHDRVTDKRVAIAVQDIAGIETALGELKDTQVTYEGIGNGELAARVAMRELRQLSTPLAKVTLVASRVAASLNIGDVFRLTWPELGIDSLVLRVAQIGFGTLTDGRVKIDCVEDVFALPQAVYVAPQPSAWQDPRQPPMAAPLRTLGELPYWSIVRELTGESAALQAEIDPEAGFLAVAAVRPTSGSINYAVLRRQGTAAFQDAGTGDFCPSCVLAAGIKQGETVLDIASGVDLDLIATDTYAAIEGELVAVRAIDALAGKVIVDRGVLDTVPAAHAAGARIFFVERWQFYRTEQYLAGEQVDVKLLPATGLGRLAEALAPTDSYTFAQRQIRPYPPGKVTLNGQSYEAPFITGALTLSWAHRSRLQQTVYLVPQSASSIGPEPGTTYTVRVYGEMGALVHTESGVAGTAWTYPLATEIAESGLGRPNERLTVTIEAVRDGYTSWQAQRIETPECRGYGMFYGSYYGE